MKLTLEHCKNVDLTHGQGNGTGYWQIPQSPRKQTVEVKDLKDAQKQFLAWIERDGLGGGNMTKKSGEVHAGKDELGAGKLVAVISYNGRVWSKHWGEEGCEEIQLDAAPTVKTLKLSGKMRVIDVASPSTVEEDEVTGTLEVPKELWGRLCCLAEGVAWDVGGAAQFIGEARKVCAHIEKFYHGDLVKQRAAITE